jgi:DNA-binding CsgD family transcriptional regulator
VKKALEDLFLFEKRVPAVFTVHDVRDLSLVYMSQRGLDLLGVTLSEITLSFQDYHSRFFNLEDAQHYVPIVTGLLERNNTEDVVTFFQQVRRSPEQEWRWYFSATKIFVRDLQEKPLLFMTLSLPIDPNSHMTSKVERLLKENEFLRKNHHLFSSLTKREKEILRYMTLGHSISELSSKLFISEATLLTHKRNIKRKLQAQSPYDLTRFAQAFDLI